MAELVIVGAGAAGCVIANRVTEGSTSALLLEAGPDYPDPSLLPADLADGNHNSMTAHDWGYRHRPTTRQYVFPLPRGKVVGGSTAVNTCIALRGHAYDYDEWGALGLTDWSWEQCLPAFKRLERDLDYGEADYHGADGPLPLRRALPNEMAPWQAGLLEAGLELGFPWCPDSNAPGSHGVGPHAMNKIDGRRISAAEAYLTSTVRRRGSFELSAATLVRRVVFDARRRVCGVEVERHGGVELIATKRVVLCGGAVGTPGILLRSGVGPRADVARIGVELIADNPGVGSQLLDHPGCAIFLLPRYTRLIPRPEHPVIQSVIRYRSALRALPDTDMQLQAGSLVAIQMRGRTLRLPLVSLMAPIGKPRGRGRLRYLSADPHAKPRVDSLLLEDARDRAQAIEAMQLCGRLAGTRALRRLARPLWPSQRVLDRYDLADQWIRKATDSGYHPSGTVKMGVDGDPLAACDGRGRVRGVMGLLVADASLMPTIPSSNINLPTLMIAERIGAWIRDGDLDF